MASNTKFTFEQQAIVLRGFFRGRLVEVRQVHRGFFWNSYNVWLIGKGHNANPYDNFQVYEEDLREAAEDEKQERKDD